MIFTTDDAIPIPVADAVTTELIGLDANLLTAIPAPHGNPDIQVEENATFTIHVPDFRYVTVDSALTDGTTLGFQSARNFLQDQN